MNYDRPQKTKLSSGENAIDVEFRAVESVLTPKSIAIVGVSDRGEGGWSKIIFDNLKESTSSSTVFLINPKREEIWGEKCYPNLGVIPDQIDVVDLFQRSEMVPPFAQEAIQIGAKVLWMQLGVENKAAAKLAEDAGLEVVMDRCMKIEYARLFGGLNFIGIDTGVISAKRPLWVPY